MANKIISTPPAAWEYLGNVQTSITTSGVAVDLTSLVDTGDLVRVEYLAAGDMIQADTWDNNGLYVRTRTQNGLKGATGFYPEVPLDFITKTTTIALNCAVYRYKSNP